MKTSFHHFTKEGSWDVPLNVSKDAANTLLLVFAGAKLSTEAQLALDQLPEKFSQSVIMGCSTAGEILSETIYDQSIVLAILAFEHTKLCLHFASVNQLNDSSTVGRQLAEAFSIECLKAIFTLTDGLLVNGSAYIHAMADALPKGMVITGGMAADGDRFQNTWVMRQGRRESGIVVACGFYGEKFICQHVSRGGWDLLGPKREVTKSVNNILYTLDDKPALELYKAYLGERSEGLPGSGLLFPLAFENSNQDDEETVRTILAVDGTEQSITFAGDIPQGSKVQLMRANFDRLIDGAADAGEALDFSQIKSDGVCIAISCVGRRLVLGARIEEELEAVTDALPENIKQVGYYSYGEISPLASGRCDLHNQTMTLTVFSEQ